MDAYDVEQKVVKVGDVVLGGRTGEYPTVLMGSLFFNGHRIVKDADKGEFDEDAAQALIKREGELSRSTGNPRIIDVIGESTQALLRYIEFAARTTDAPLLLDSPFQKVRMEAVRELAGSELMNRIIYNSIAEDYTEEELACLKECGVKHAVVLAFSKRAMRPKDMLRLLEDRLLPAADRAGIRNLLVDVGVLDVPGVGWASEAVREVKDKFGLPAGCAPANALYQWRAKSKKWKEFTGASAAVLTVPQCFGADFLMYGSLANAPWVYPACAATDGLLAYRARLHGVRTLVEEHPLYRIF